MFCAKLVQFACIKNSHLHSCLPAKQKRFLLFSTVVLNLWWFAASFQKLSTLVAPSSSIGFCNITAELLSTGICSWSPENRSVAPKAGRGPQLRNHGLALHIVMSGEPKTVLNYFDSVRFRPRSVSIATVKSVKIYEHLCHWRKHGLVLSYGGSWFCGCYADCLKPP